MNAEIERIKAEVQKPAKRTGGGRVIESPKAEGPMKKIELVDLTVDDSGDD